jgi:hypothetical protein
MAFMRMWIAIAVCGAGVAAVVTSARAAITADLANTCRAMMVQAHPTVLYGTGGTAALQRQYFKECIKRQGKMDDNPEPPDRHRPYT